MPPDKERGRPGGATSRTNVGTTVIAEDTRSTVDTCTFCGAPALEPNRADRRRGLGWIMVHASWCPTQSMGPIAHSTKWARS